MTNRDEDRSVEEFAHTFGIPPEPVEADPAVDDFAKAVGFDSDEQPATDERTAAKDQPTEDGTAGFDPAALFTAPQPAEVEQPVADYQTSTAPPPGAWTPEPKAEAPEYLTDPDQPRFDQEPLNTSSNRGRSRMPLIIAGAVVLTLVIILAVVLSILLTGNDGGSDGSTEDVAIAGVEGGESDSADTAPPVARDLDPTFSWWGDGLSVVASQYQPIIGTKGHDYYWTADNSTTPDEAITQIASAGDRRGGVVVFAHGNSSEVTEAHLAQLQSAIGDRPLILVGVGTADSTAIPWARDVNRRYEALADFRPDTYFVDWQGYVDDNPLVVSDGFILTREGTATWANAINYAVLAAYDTN